MINLLPPDVIENYRFARRNRVVRRWIWGGVVVLIGAALLLGGGDLYLRQSTSNMSKQIDDTNKQLAAQDLAGTQKKVTAISNNLKLTVKVLSQEILFSKLLKQLASVTPSNAILTNLTISDTQGGVDITAETGDYNAATQLQVNLADPKNQIFSKADIISITCNGKAPYPCIVDIRALFGTNSQFLFINDGKATS